MLELLFSLWFMLELLFSLWCMLELLFSLWCMLATSELLELFTFPSVSSGASGTGPTGKGSRKKVFFMAIERGGRGEGPATIFFLNWKKSSDGH